MRGEEWRPMNMHSFARSPLSKPTNGMKHTRTGRNEASAGGLAKRINAVPEAIEMQSRVAKFMATVRQWRQAVFDWGGAENLAYAAGR